MKIDLQAIDPTQLMVHEHIVNGEVLYLVQPQHIGCDWRQDNKHFRSSVWNAQGELVSAGFPKFTNWGEKPEQFPLPKDLTGATVVEKIDGSLLVVSKYKGEFILRTRGTVDASKLDNGHELEVFKETILPKLKNLYQPVPEHDTWRHSYLLEWTSPLQKIVLNYGDTPDWSLVGIIDHNNYSLETQGFLNKLAQQLSLKRPQTYTFSTIDDLLANVDEWKGKEGVCVYSNNGQTIHKVKSSWYLVLHRMKTELASFEKVLDVWISQGKPDYTTFYNNIATQFDFELANQIRGDMSRIAEGYKEVQQLITHMRGFVLPLMSSHVGEPGKPDKNVRPQRKWQAEQIIGAYGNTNRASFCFKLLDGKELGDDDIKKFMF